MCNPVYLFTFHTREKFPLPVLIKPEKTLLLATKSILVLILRIIRLTKTRLSASRSVKDPEMQMNLYNLDEIMLVIQSLAITKVHLEFTNHDGVLGAFLYFQKPIKVKGRDLSQ